MLRSVIAWTLVGAACLLSGCEKSAPRSPLPVYELDELQHDSAAHWVSRRLILTRSATPDAYLLSNAAGQLDDGALPDQIIPLQPIDQPPFVASRWPHLKDFYAFEVSVDEDLGKELLKHQLAVLQLDRHGEARGLSYLQTAGVIDDVYTSGDNDADENDILGARNDGQQTQFSLWAPTAQAVSVRLFDNDKQSLSDPIPLNQDTVTGIWHTSSNASVGTYYQYSIRTYHYRPKEVVTVQVTDPYSLSLSTNSHFSQVVNLNDPQTQPDGWSQDASPSLTNLEDQILYEVHIRDFSATDASLSDPSWRGKYAAFSDLDSAPMQHLQRLQAAGLNTIHLLPTYDMSTVDERPGWPVTLDTTFADVCERYAVNTICDEPAWPMTMTVGDALASLSPDSDDAQALVDALRGFDAFNWGYDPYHYTVPEGSYALDPEGMSRLKEFRSMVQSLHAMGLRVIMDVVYNHTFASGLDEKSVLDKVVPGYYHRRNPISGDIERSTCCENTATERVMMGKLMVDSLVTWARDYHIDGFRFDLMGHQPKALMLAAREAVQAVDPDTYFYGEGWNFGEVADHQRFEQASQRALAGTQIGTFSDRLRDAVRGGSSFLFADDIRRSQGIGNGLKVFPNELQQGADNHDMQQEYELSMDQLRVGLAGNLTSFTFTAQSGEEMQGLEVDFGGEPTAYAADPADTINYVSKHDNQTLWDNHQYRLPAELSPEQRMRAQLLSLAYPMYAQGIPFFHMGSELLRSKSFLRDSFDYGDWFNRVDFSMTHNNYHVGLPPADQDSRNWPLIQRLLKDNQGRDQVSPALIRQSAAMFMDMLRVRSQSPLLRLTDAQQIQQALRFLNTGQQHQPGMIALHIKDSDDNIDPNVSAMLLLFNQSLNPISLALPEASQYQLHPALQNGSDEVVKDTQISADSIQVPALTVAVLVTPQSS
ncbi:pullulanase-type alpha-1,6-glucosidase [Aestuariibacter halophilus]|uniref:Pullulanase-type alpha-1,6-glucosidase n=1 Tax=Fluctibacter halophilus TaxID=226011 RepID=A0ABS8GCI9_9ALTE|nr:pullulanase-type alpha-1,6-glucosidase [Aestuariibacter halophilus]MCC2618108.1 pullulanase-type alpha-1,6-glucosidase [Aestuariibacter halophilus]